MSGPRTAARRIACVVGTRPEAIKMAPLIFALKREPVFEVRVVASGQHADMLTQALEYFGIEADVNLGVMESAQTLDHVTSAVLKGVGAFLDSAPQDMLLVHGDTTTTLGAALAAFYRKIPLGHVEAGLRSRDLTRPFPEEANRVLTDRISTLFFAPTRQAAENLRAEGVAEPRVFVTGNTVIDALFWTLGRGDAPLSGGLGLSLSLDKVPPGAPLALLTAHRRESWGAPLTRICGAARRLLEKYPALWFLVPLHKNPAVRETIAGELGGRPRVIFTEPLSYPEFVAAMNRSVFILSDSGGVQEEASALRKPVLILRDLSERPEALSEGTGVLVGTDGDRIEREASRILEDELYRASFAARVSPFGDGHAGERIAKIIRDYFSEER
ncbi:MAG: UDP-N-acetylglucosamine 2-epimerase (non-hydrolyzing) [Synergistaceae bacterium]|jgi:UDP-N-acetylglucosamine 2-epimerase (non-hydrolysing)|nr:UDP-N-acetylglucosamine 2-epimerase (non-hydrolyzing) [Synergistaceae bacterium]